MAFEAERARAYLAEGLRLLDSLDRRSALCVGDLRRPVSRDARPDRGGRLRRLRREDAALGSAQARRRGARAAAVKVAVVGGGLAGLAAALDLVDAGHAVTVYEARPTLGGAVQTLPEREGDPEPPPDNGQHIALGCFTEYVRFLERIGEGGSFLRTRLALPVLDEDGAVASIEPSLPALLSRTGTCRCAIGSGSRSPQLRCALRRRDPSETFGQLLRRLGATDAVDRPVLGRLRAAGAQPPLRRGRRRGGPLHGPHGAARPAREQRPRSSRRGRSGRCTATQPERRSRPPASTVHSDARVESLDELDADAVVVAVPPRESARLLGEPEPELEDSPIVSVHLWFDRPLLEPPLAALLGSDAHWVFDRGALTGQPARAGAVPHGRLERRARAARGARSRARRADRRASSRSGSAQAELLWSRVSREPYATVALRPGVGDRESRPPAPTSSAQARGPTPAGRRRWRARSAAAAGRLSTS